VPLTGGAGAPVDRGRIAPWISKDSARSSFKTVGANAVGKTVYNSEFQYGDILQGQYPLTASITREFVTGSRTDPYSPQKYPVNKEQKHYVALRNRLDFYAIRSPHYKVESPYGNKDAQKINMISIPSIFYGTKIKPGSVSLKWNYTGSLMAELRDLKENGELIQVSGSNTTAVLHDGKIAGVILYDEGIILLTGSWDLTTTALGLKDASTAVTPSWLYYGVGANDGLSQANLMANYVTASYNLNFKGHTETQVVTMFAHARRGEVNYSNNPTFIEHGQNHAEFTSSHVYQEKDDILLKNIVSSSYTDYSASFNRQLYISRVTIYDKYKNLMGVATISNPILKKEGQDYSFKIKLDI